MLSPRLLWLAHKYLPDFILTRIDPFSATIDSFVYKSAQETQGNAWVLDAGAGEALYRDFFLGTHYVALDNGIGDKSWDYSGLDVLADLAFLPFKDKTFHIVLNIVVLEHLSCPQKSLQEIFRALKSNGKLYMAVPQSWELHQKPHDYQRFTKYGLKQILGDSGFVIEYLGPIGGYFWYIGRRLMHILSFFQTGWKRIFLLFLAPIFGLIIPLLCFYLDRWDKEKDHTLGYLCIARKPGPLIGQ
jgi:SAM-dependent methyltransferase